jgi:hypothetical protein
MRVFAGSTLTSASQRRWALSPYLSPRDYTIRPATRTSPAAPGSAGGRGGVNAQVE